MTSVNSDAEEKDLLYITTFTGTVIVEAANEGMARDRAEVWGIEYLTENTVVLEDKPILPVSAETAGKFSVPVAGTYSFIGPSQEAVDQKVARHIEIARHTGPYLHIIMGEFFIHSGEPHLQ